MNKKQKKKSPSASSSEPKGKTNPKQNFSSQKKLRIIPLGGQEEVGRNMNVFEYNQDIVIIDMGMQFPEEEMPGIDYIIPNIKYLKGQEKNIRGVIFTHGHLDHIGAAPILLEKLGYPPVIGRPLTLAMIKSRLEDYKKGSSKRLKTIEIKNIKQKIKLASFEASFFPVDHSTMDAMGIVLKTPQANIIHPGDWTYEENPVKRKSINYHHLSRLKKPTVLMLESLASTSNRPRVPEKTMYQNIEKLIKEASGRIILATFSSQIERIKNIIPLAEKFGRKVAFDGYSMRLNMEIAKKLGYIKFKKSNIIPIKKINKYPDNKVLIFCTGAQGEPRAVLSRMVEGSHKYVQIKKKDTVIFSSSVIPGNERSIQKLKDSLYRLSDNVIHNDIMDVHSSGHATAQDMIKVVRQIKPTYFMPVYAHYYFLKEAEKLIARDNFAKKNIFVLENGQTLEFKNKKPRKIKKKVPTNYIMVDGLGVGDVGEIVLRDRNVLAKDGMVVIILKVDDKNKKIIGEPDIISRGFVYMKKSNKLIKDTKQKVKDIFNSAPRRKTNYWDPLKSKIRDDIGQYLFNKTERRPMILPVLIEV
ncbi:MAG: ribonuclease J [Patescibacteria group bacterium]|nr:ribonuclease J [Patescibacteria group bacterium]